MATLFNTYRVNSLPSTGVNGDRYILRKSNNRFEEYIVAPNGELVFQKGITDEENSIFRDKYTRNEIDLKIRDIGLSVTGSITTTQTLTQLNALPDGIYEAQTSGTYANGLTAKVGYYTKFKKEGTVWSLLSEILMPSLAGKDTFNPKGTGVANERATAEYVAPALDIVEESVNLANNKNVIRGAYILSDGSFVSSDNSISLRPFAVDPTKTHISVEGVGTIPASYARFVFYGSSTTILGTSNSNINVPIPSGTKFIGMSIVNQTGVGIEPITNPYANTMMLNYGATALPYRPYKVLVNSLTVNNTNKRFVEQTDLENNYTIGVLSNARDSSASAVLFLNREVDNDGSVIKKIRVNTISTGNLKLQKIRRDTYNNPTPSAGNQENFTLLETYNFNIATAGVNELDVNIPISKGEYIGVDSTGGVRMTWNAILGSTTYGWWQRTANPSVYTYQPIDINLQMDISFEKYSSKAQEPTYTTIVASRNAENYNSIRNIVNGIVDATEMNRYIIKVPKGRWFEVDIKSKPWVEIVGADINETILYCDGNDNVKVLPADYSYIPEAGKVINTVNQQYLHVVFGVSSGQFSNLTLEQSRGKYAAHLDDAGMGEITFNDVKFVGLATTTYPVGIGLRAKQKLNFNRCVFEREIETTFHINGKLGIFFHNWNNQNDSCELNLVNCRFVNCGYVMIDELGSNHQDKVNLLNCSTNDIGQITFMVDMSGGKSLWTNGSGVKEPNPKNVPYCIVVNATGTKVDLVVDRSAVNFDAPYNTGGQRPNWHNYLVSDYWGWAIVNTGTTIVKGDLLAYGGTSASNVNTPVAKKFVGFSDAPILGIALTDSSSGKVKYVPVDKYTEALVNGIIGSGDLEKKIVWDDVNKYLKSDSSADIRYIQGIALTNKLITDTYGYIKLK